MLSNKERKTCSLKTVKSELHISLGKLLRKNGFQ
jgi:hypothetical protein